HAYVLMERYQDAVEALAHARKLAGDGNAEVLSAYGEALALADPDHFMQRAAPVFENVLKFAPDNQKALWYGGLAASQRGDNALAVTRWQALLRQGLPPKYSAILVNYIKEAGGSVSPATPAHEATILHLRVTLNPSLKKKLDAGATVFVFARPEGEQGGPPLAVRRFTVRDLPLTTTLGDQDAMVAGRSLGRFKVLEVVARVSRDGSPMPKAGEPQGKAVWKRGSKQPLAIEIKPSRT
ncbi:MAG TPA: hypothetical protein VFM15_05530, partial [Gammaproteobacteria bacterium]|nr:hypothetical protein [Gammaproteobacteria bacterium]